MGEVVASRRTLAKRQRIALASTLALLALIPTAWVLFSGARPAIAATEGKQGNTPPAAAVSAGSGKAAAPAQTAGEAISEVLRHPILRNAQVGLMAVDLDRGRTIYAYEADRLLNPASVVKLFTGTAALQILRPEYRFKSSAWTTKKLDQKGTLAGNLFIRGGGDPTLVSERMWLWVTEMHHLGLRRVEGDLVIDESFFDGDRVGPGYEEENTDFAYMAPTGALSINFNALGVYIRPAETAGQLAKVSIEPQIPFFELDARVQTKARAGRYLLVGSHPRADGRQEVKARGWIGKDESMKVIWRKIDNPPIYAGETMKDLLRRRGIQVTGKVRVGKVPKDALPFHTFVSRRLSEVLDDLNKYSNNFVAEMIVKTIGAETMDGPGSWKTGTEAIRRFLKRDVGIQPDTYVLRNGSGLNDTNRFTAAQVVRLLDYIYRTREIAYELIPSLGVAGASGTVRKRMTSDLSHHKVRVKTGTLTGVTALSGYVMSRDREVIAFAIVANGLKVSSRRASAVIDRIAEALSGLPLEGGPTTLAKPLVRGKP
ncbi:MAG: D-alanyl-D-alanine carboxypeptidase/D-alanyl-D-alanine-endopeptidase [Myxococcales bacterium]|nr:D-alanyl-D-alanine carboxypeptidase/D-alanyl-D-alanine-endopeptidase [Myxococcales bacterium]